MAGQSTKTAFPGSLRVRSCPDFAVGNRPPSHRESRDGRDSRGNAEKKPSPVPWGPIDDTRPA
ncbi:hypothetical protein ACH4Y0_30530 [Streptomyces sp. NPDC020707]|uniref:hypothetical protein n=1 Tax=Streptomyces sp. NPDC020707 TaxID=3365084 RepID=UPI00378E54CB